MQVLTLIFSALACGLGMLNRKNILDLRGELVKVVTGHLRQEGPIAAQETAARVKAEATSKSRVRVLTL